MKDISLNLDDESSKLSASDPGSLEGLTDEESALKRAILGKFNSQFAKSKSQLDEMLEELLRLNIR
jgi:hypothetical protein